MGCWFSFLPSRVLIFVHPKRTDARKIFADHCPEQTFFCSPTRSKLEEKHHFSGAYATAPPQTICLSRPVLVVRISKSRHVSSQFLQNEIRLNSSKQETTSIPVIEKV